MPKSFNHSMKQALPLHDELPTFVKLEAIAAARSAPEPDLPEALKISLPQSDWIGWEKGPVMAFVDSSRSAMGSKGPPWNEQSQNCTVGAAFSSPGVSKNGSSLKPNIPAITTVGNV